jgi:hypothetical protein
MRTSIMTVGKNGTLEEERLTKFLANRIKAQMKIDYPKMKLSISTDYNSIRVHVIQNDKTIVAPGVDTSRDFMVIMSIDEDLRLNDLGKKIFKAMTEIIQPYLESDGDTYGDYGARPNIYYGLNVGKFEKPFTVVEK